MTVCGYLCCWQQTALVHATRRACRCNPLIRCAPSTKSAAGAPPQVAFCLTCSQILEITTEPSPTAEATRFTDPARTSPTAKMPG